MADFANARDWDPSVSEARRVGEAPIGIGSAFDLVARFGGRTFRSATRSSNTTHHDASCSRRSVRDSSRGTPSRSSLTGGSVVHYDATLAFGGLGRLLDPIMQRIFNRVGARATLGMQTALNP